MFAASLADRVVQRSDASSGPMRHIFARPLAAVFSSSIVHIDLPLVIPGRTAKSGFNDRPLEPRQAADPEDDWRRPRPD